VLLKTGAPDYATGWSVNLTYTEGNGLQVGGQVTINRGTGAGKPLLRLYTNNGISTFSSDGASNLTLDNPLSVPTLLLGSGGIVFTSYGVTVDTNAARYSNVGSLTLNADPTTAMQAATKKYVDNQFTQTPPLMVPANIFAETIDRRSYSSGNTPTSGQLTMGLCVIPAGKTITAVSIVSNVASATISNCWVCLVRPSDGLVLSKSTDFGATIWTANTLRKFTGLNYTPAADELVYVGLVYVGTSLSIAASVLVALGAAITPALTQVGNSGLTNPASLGANVTFSGNIGWLMWAGLGT
jgi:hypothetical protein